jgi:hypothetical protein
MRSTFIIALLLAVPALGQTTRPSSNPAYIIAQLKEENARLKAEVQELRRQLNELRPAPVDASADRS